MRAGAPLTDDMSEGPPLKRNKVSAACDVCRNKKIKCDGVQPECGPCLVRPNHNARCSWQHSISRGAFPMPEEVARLQQQIRDLEQKLNTQSVANYERQSQPYLDGRTSHLEAHNGERHQPVDPSVGFCRPERPSSSRVPGERVALSAPAQQSGREPSVLIDDDSPASAMVGSLEDTAISHRFFGGSSAGNFMNYVRKVVARSGRSNDSPPSSMAGTLGRPRSPVHRHWRRSLNADDWALPPRSRADALMSVYWDIVHPLYPYIDRTVLMTHYCNLFSGRGSADVDVSVLCSLNMIFALSCQLDTTVSAERRKTSSSVFFLRAQGLLDLWKMDESVESVQALLLLGQYLQSTNEPSQCWLFVGAAIRMAQSLGLHLMHHGDSESAATGRRKEVRRRVWHGCVFMDRVLAMTYGRPTMISRSVASATPLPLAVDDEEFGEGQDLAARPGAPTKLDFFIHSLKLHDILEQLLENDPSTSGNGDQASFISVDAKLMAWELALPQHLKDGHLIGNTEQAQASTKQMVLLRQAVVLRQRYLHIRLLALRPILSAQIATDINDFSNQPLGTNLSRRLAHQCSIVCIKIAQEAIDLVHTHRASDWATTGLLAAWWYNVLFVYSAATVLVAAKLRPISDPELSHESTAESWRRAMNILQGYRDYSKSIPRLITTLEVLSAEIPERYSHYVQASAQNVEHRQSVMPLHRTNGRQIGVPTAQTGRYNMEPAMIPADLQEVPMYNMDFGSGGSQEGDYSELIFDPGDLSWLNSMPVEF